MNKKNKISKLGKTSVKKKLVVLPLIIIFLAISGIAFVSSYLLRESLLKQMRSQGMEYVDKIVSEIDVNANSFNIISNLIEGQLKRSSDIIIKNENNLSNEFLIETAKDLGINDIYWYNENSEIIYSTNLSYLGWKPGTSHPVYRFFSSNSKELIEDIRKDSESDNFFKYAYKKSNNGSFVQVGISANVINELTEKFSYQALVTNISKGDNVVYALFIDKNLTAIAHSNKNRIGLKLRAV